MTPSFKPGKTHMKAEGKTLSFDPNLRPVLWKSEAEMVEKLNRLAALTPRER
jgi:sugar/nucleoside kinase (ribokinase family)